MLSNGGESPMNRWSQSHRLRRHAIQSSFVALERRDAHALSAWRDATGITAMLGEAFGGPRRPFLAAMMAPRPLQVPVLIHGWTVRLAERVQQGWAPDSVLDWWLDRPGVWMEREVRTRFGAGMVKSLRSGCRCVGRQVPDALALDAMFTGAVMAALDACEGYDPSQPVAGWIRGVAYHTGREWARVEERRSLQLPRADIDPDAVPVHRAEGEVLVDMADETSWVVAAALRGSTLPGESVIVASILEGQRSAESVGRELSLSVKRVYKRTAAARARLREAMDRLANP